MVARRLGLCVWMCFLVVPAVARAQESKSTEAAKIHFQAGEQFYRRGLYPQAIGEFKEAYRLSKAPALLYNISLAYEKNDDLVNARDYLKRYVDSGQTDPGELPSLREKLASLDKRIEAQKPPPETPPAAPPPTEHPAPVPPPAAPGAEAKSRPLKTWKWVTGGVGAGAILVAVLAGIDGKKQEDKIVSESQKSVPYSSDLDKAWKRGVRDNAAVALFGVAGVALVGTSVVLFILDSKRGAEQEGPRLVPVVGPGTAGAAAVWRF